MNFPGEVQAQARDSRFPTPHLKRRDKRREKDSYSPQIKPPQKPPDTFCSHQTCAGSPLLTDMLTQAHTNCQKLTNDISSFNLCTEATDAATQNKKARLFSHLNNTITLFNGLALVFLHPLTYLLCIILIL